MKEKSLSKIISKNQKIENIQIISAYYAGIKNINRTVVGTTPAQLGATPVMARGYAMIR
jgi:hypothetical protein